MRRFFIALECASDPPPLRAVAEGLNYAVKEAEEAGVNPSDDPAVLLLGAFVAFRTHADVNTVGGYRRLMALCEDRISEKASDDQVPSKIKAS